MNKKNIYVIIKIFIFVGLIFLGLYLHENRVYHYQKSALIMDTLVDIQIGIKDDNGMKIISKTFDLMQEYDDLLDYHDEESELSILNSKTESKMFPELYEMLKIGKKLYNESAFRYDLSIGKLSDLWENENIPSKEEILSAKEFTGFDKIKFDSKTINKPEELKLNLGSIAKGFIIDKAIEYLIENGVESAIVNAGGDIRIFGYDNKIAVGVQHPRAENEIIAKLNVGNVALVTSGDYERYFIKDGIRYNHIIDATTGYPANENISVSVIAKNATLADAYATTFFVMPAKKALELANKTDDVDLYLVKMENDELKTFKSNGMEKYLTKEF